MNDMLCSVSEKVNKLVDDYDMLKNNYDALNNSVSAIENSQSSIDNNLLKKVKKAAQEMTKNHLELRTLQLKTQVMADEVTISGTPEQLSENLSKIVLNLSKNVNVPIIGGEIVKVGRMGEPDKNRSRSRNILVKLRNHRYVSDLITNIRNNPLKVGKLIPGCDKELDTSIYIHRRHPPALYKLRMDVRKQFPNILPKTV